MLASMPNPDAQGSEEPAPNLVLFSAAAGGEVGGTADFIYQGDGTFHIQLNGQPLSHVIWAEDDVESALRTYLRIVS